MASVKGVLITFEGLDGAGKTVNLSYLKVGSFKSDTKPYTLMSRRTVPLEI